MRAIIVFCVIVQRKIDDRGVCGNSLTSRFCFFTQPLTILLGSVWSNGRSFGCQPEGIEFGSRFGIVTVRRLLN